MSLLAMPCGQEIGAALLVFVDPFPGEAAVADFGKNFAHFLASLGRNDSWSGGVVALLCGVADGIAHVAEAAAIDEVDDQLQLVHAFKVGHFGLVACVDESVEAGFYQLADASAKNRLLAEEIGFGLFGKCGFEDACARAAEALCVGESERLGFTGGVLLDREKCGCSAAFSEYFANTMAGSFGRDHGDVHVCRSFNRAEANIEAVREHQRLACGEIWGDGIAIQLGL